MGSSGEADGVEGPFAFRVLLGVALYGSYRLRLAGEFPAERGSARRGTFEDNGPGSKVGEASLSSASPRYRGWPSGPISTLGGFLK